MDETCDIAYTQAMFDTPWECTGVVLPVATIVKLEASGGVPGILVVESWTEARCTGGLLEEASTVKGREMDR